MWLHLGIGVSGAMFMLLRLFGGGTIGLSDQGDGHRLLCSLGLRQANPYNTSTIDYLYPVWLDHRWYGEDCGATGTGEPYHSTQLWFAAFGKFLTHLLTSTDGLDLRVLGVVFALLVGLLVALITLLVPGGAGIKVTVAIALLLVLGDGAFAGYFVSAYSEPAGFVGLLVLLIAVLLFVREQRVRWWTVALLAGATMFTVAAKTQTASLLLPAIAVLLSRPTFPGRANRWPAVAVSLALIAGTAAFLGAQPERFTVQNDYNAVFIEMLPHSPDPAADLRALGLPESMASSSGIPIDAPGSAAADPAFQGFTEKAGLGDRMALYARDPQRLAGMFGRGLAGMGRLRADYVYSYPPTAEGGPGRLECRVCVFQSSWQGSIGHAPLLLVPLLVGAVAICLRTARRSADRRARAVGATGLFLAGSVVTQFWVVMLTEGESDLIKHLVFANLMSGLLLVFAGASALCLLTQPRREVHEEERVPEFAGTRWES